MKFWIYILDHSSTIVIILIVWCIGVLLGGKISRIKQVIIKHTTKIYPTTIKGDALQEQMVIQSKRDYTINLILKDDKDFPYDNISTFSMKLDEIIKDGKLLNYSSVQQMEQNKNTLIPDTRIIPNFTEEDIEDLVTPESYSNG